MLEYFINDALFCFDEDLARYLEWVADNKLRHELRQGRTKQYFLIKYQKRSLQDISYYL